MSKCNNCREVQHCECQVKDLATKCIMYEGSYLENLGIDRYTNLTDVLKIIDLHIKELKETEQASNISTVINVGEGAEIFKTIDSLKRIQLKTLSEGGDIINVIEGDEEITIEADENVIRQLISEVAPKNITFSYSPESVVASETDDRTLTFRDIVAGEGIGINRTPTSIEVYSEVQVPNITSNTLQVTTEGETVRVEVMEDGVPKIFVNSLYTGSVSNGTESNPYKTLNQAIQAYIGSGSSTQPELQGTQIIVKRGSYTTPSSMMVKDLHLIIRDGAIVSDNFTTGITFDFDSLPSDVSKFNILIECEGSGVFRYSRQIMKNHGYNQGVSDNTWVGRNLTLKDVSLRPNNNNSFTLFQSGNSETWTHNNNQAPLTIRGGEIRGNSNIRIFDFINTKDTVIKGTSIRFNDPNSPINNDKHLGVFSGVYVRFEDCHFHGFEANTNGIFRLVKTEEMSPDIQRKIEFKNCIFEGRATRFFVVSSNAPELIIQRASSFYQEFGKLIHSESGLPVTQTTIVESYFTSPKGDVDLTRGNTQSVTNYFSGKITESLIKSGSILTDSDHPEGTPYIFTNGDSSDKNTWRRTVVFA